MPQRFIRIGIPFAAAVTLGYLAGLKGLQIGWESFRIGAETPAGSRTSGEHSVESGGGDDLLRVVPGSARGLAPDSVEGCLPPFDRRGIGRSGDAIRGPASSPHFGNSLTPLLGLPSWLLGVFLAESFHQFKDGVVSRTVIWAWASGVNRSCFGLAGAFLSPALLFSVRRLPLDPAIIRGPGVLLVATGDPVVAAESTGAHTRMVRVAGAIPSTCSTLQPPPVMGWLMQSLGRPPIPPLALGAVAGSHGVPIVLSSSPASLEFPSWTPGAPSGFPSCAIQQTKVFKHPPTAARNDGLNGPAIRERNTLAPGKYWLHGPVRHPIHRQDSASGCGRKLSPEMRASSSFRRA